MSCPTSIHHASRFDTTPAARRFSDPVRRLTGRASARALITLVLLSVAGFAGVADVAAAKPAPISSAEATALSLVALHLESGPSAVIERLAPDAPWRSLGDDGALRELEVRLGPARGAQWTLARLGQNHSPNQVAFHVVFPSGIDDLVVFQVGPRGDVFYDVKILAEQRKEAMRLAALAPLRTAVTSGTRGLDAGLYSESTGDPKLDGVRTLWLAQHLLVRGERNRAEDTLPLRMERARPLELLIRGRIAAQRDDLVTAGSRLGDLVGGGGWDVDVLQWEKVISSSLPFDVSQILPGLAHIERMGSRNSEFYYMMARYRLFQSSKLATQTFLQAWQLEPMERKRLVEDPFLVNFLAQRDVFALLRVDHPDEPRVAPRMVTSKSVSWSPQAKLHVSGERLLAEIGGGRLVIPGGAGLAPSGLRTESAAEAADRETRRILERLPRLVEQASRPQTYESNRLVREIEETAYVLVEAKRWNDLVRLTRAVDRADDPPVYIAQYRALALEATGQVQQAVNLLAKLTADIEALRDDPGAVYFLARLCADHDRPDLALRLLRRISTLRPFSGVERLMRGFELDLRLKEEYRTYESANFRLRYPVDVEEGQVILVAGFLEAERERIQQWIPFRAEGPAIDVQLVAARDFYQVYGGGVGIAGLYDGRIRLPVFEVGKETSVMASTVSHELAHAMIDRYVGDSGVGLGAPKWFHEGLAQLVEPDQGQVNPYRSRSQIITFPLVEPILRGFSDDELVGLAYQEAYWTLRYVEEKKGKAGIRALLDAFAARKSTNEALRGAFQASPQDFDRGLQAWAGSGEAPMEDRGREIDFDPGSAARVAEATPGLREEIERRQAEVRELPKVGFKDGAEAAYRKYEDEIVEDMQRHMDSWYEGYRSVADPIRKDLATLVKVSRGLPIDTNERPDFICRRLSNSLMLFLGGGFQSVDKDVNDSLRQAYTAFSRFAHGCGGDEHLKTAERHLRNAAHHMEKYGLRP